MPKVAKKDLIAGLNIDLANEYAAVITYRTYASLVQGPWRQELRNFFAAEIPDELLHAQMLCDKIVALG
ncbi:MAG TPA: ferritin-like domain-containing protein, partial [Thermoanaerobaculia bacterium]|nr:ferritin-like domain-containing protein [Thermoanaerobaculia bacterium]